MAKKKTSNNEQMWSTAAPAAVPNHTRPQTVRGLSQSSLSELFIFLKPNQRERDFDPLPSTVIPSPPFLPPTHPAAVCTAALCSRQVDVERREQHLRRERNLYCLLQSTMQHPSTWDTIHTYIITDVACLLCFPSFFFNDNTELTTTIYKHSRPLTIAPPPMTPPMYFTSSVMRPSLAYWTSPAGKNSTMLQMMDRRASGYRATAMKREHFPVHMVGFFSSAVRAPVQSEAPVPECVQRKETGLALNTVSRFLGVGRMTIW